MHKELTVLHKYGFLLSELVKRDFKKKYKSTFLGIIWSLLSPLLSLFVMSIVFKSFFGRNQPHYTTYVFSGNLVFSFFSDSTVGGMGALSANSDIFSRISLPKYLFVISKNVTSLINFALTFCIFIFFCFFDGIAPSLSFLSLLFTIVVLAVFNLGIGLLLSVLFVFFRDVQYLWSIFTMLLMYVSAIFYTTEPFSQRARGLFYLNPVYTYIKSFRVAVIDGTAPSPSLVLLGMLYALFALALGVYTYKRYNTKLIYYI